MSKILGLILQDSAINSCAHHGLFCKPFGKQLLHRPTLGLIHASLKTEAAIASVLLSSADIWRDIENQDAPMAVWLRAAASRKVFLVSL